MTSRATRKFWQLYEALPDEVQQDGRRCYRLFQANPGHPSLHFKKLQGQEGVYSVRIGLHYRALAVVKGSEAIWYWLGTHAEYDRLA